MYAARRQTDKSRNGSSQVQKCMKLDGPFGFAERGPGKKRQAKIDRCGVQSIDGVLQIDFQLFAPVERLSDGNEMIAEVLVDPVIPQFVGIGQG